MNFSVTIAVAVYFTLLTLFVVSVAHKTGRVIDLVQEVASHLRPERVPVKVLEPQTSTLPRNRRQEHFSGQDS